MNRVRDIASELDREILKARGEAEEGEVAAIEKEEKPTQTQSA